MNIGKFPKEFRRVVRREGGLRSWLEGVATAAGKGRERHSR